MSNTELPCGDKDQQYSHLINFLMISHKEDITIATNSIVTVCKSTLNRHMLIF